MEMGRTWESEDGKFDLVYFGIITPYPQIYYARGLAVGLKYAEGSVGFVEITLYLENPDRLLVVQLVPVRCI